MSVDIVDLKRKEHSRYCNAWNWRPTVELIRATGLIDDERLKRMGSNCSGVEVSEAEARAIARFLQEQVLPRLRPQDRVLLDLGVTDVPDDGTFHREPAELHKNYSASYEWLEEFATFCKECQGFTVE
jgi:hypothetical protein